MIRHGAELVHAYAAATVPRLCVVLRKAYGGAYIVMDSKNLGNDWCVAWPTAEIAVMGAPRRGADPPPPPARGHRRRRRARSPSSSRSRPSTRTRFANPYVAAERGYVDDVIAAVRHPARARRRARCGSRTKREQQPTRRHSNTPL